MGYGLGTLCLGEGGPEAAGASSRGSAPPPSGPAPPRPQAPPLRAASESSFRVALGRARRDRAEAREFGGSPRAPASPRRLVAGEAHGARSPGPCRVRPFLYFFLLRVSIFLLRLWGWAWPGRSAALGEPRRALRRSPLASPPPPPTPRSRGLLGTLKTACGPAALLCASLPAGREALPPLASGRVCLHRGVCGPWWLRARRWPCSPASAPCTSLLLCVLP